MNSSSLYNNVTNAGFVGLFAGFLLGLVFMLMLTSLRSPLDYHRNCDPETEVAVLLVAPDGANRDSACLEEWRVVYP